MKPCKTVLTTRHLKWKLNYDMFLFGSKNTIFLIVVFNSILAIIFGAIGMKAGGPQSKTAKTGMILGIIALCWGLIVTVACLACIGAGAGIGAGLGLFD